MTCCVGEAECWAHSTSTASTKTFGEAVAVQLLPQSVVDFSIPCPLRTCDEKVVLKPKRKVPGTAEENLKTWAECLVRRDQHAFMSFGLESYHICSLEPRAMRLFWGATGCRSAGGEWAAVAPPAAKRGWSAGSWHVFPHNCCGVTGPLEPYFLGTCLTKPLLVSFTVMLCPEATKDVFNLKFSVIGAVGLVAVIMVFGGIFSMFLCCAIHLLPELQTQKLLQYRFLFFFNRHSSLHRRAWERGHQLN